MYTQCHAYTHSHMHNMHAHTHAYVRTHTHTNTHRFDRAYQRVKEEVTLPALKPHISNNVAERQRRAHAVKNKLGRSVP